MAIIGIRIDLTALFLLIAYMLCLQYCINASTLSEEAGESEIVIEDFEIIKLYLNKN